MSSDFFTSEHIGIIENYLLDRSRDSPKTVIEKLNAYLSILLEGNKVINLIGASTIEDIANRHVLDCLQLIKHLPIKGKIVDLGSGAGLPGLIIAIATDLSVTMFEKSNLKSDFLNHVIAKLDLKNARVMNQNILDVERISADFITCRAFKSLDQICSIALNFSTPPHLLLLKGMKWKQEVQEAQKNFLFSHNIYPSVTSSEGVILEINSLKNETF